MKSYFQKKKKKKDPFVRSKFGCHSSIIGVVISYLINDIIN